MQKTLQTRNRSSFHCSSSNVNGYELVHNSGRKKLGARISGCWGSCWRRYTRRILGRHALKLVSAKPLNSGKVIALSTASKQKKCDGCPRFKGGINNQGAACSSSVTPVHMPFIIACWPKYYYINDVVTVLHHLRLIIA
jgi:hypothetical protein